MAEKIKLSGVPETMLQTVYARAKESTGRGAQYRVVPAHQRLGTDDLAGVQASRFSTF